VTGLYLTNSSAQNISANGALLFDTTVTSSDSNASLNASTGVVTFTNAGNYQISWNASISTAMDKKASFGIFLNGALSSFSSSSTIKDGLISGSFYLSVSAGETLSLNNISSGAISLINGNGNNASLQITNLSSLALTSEGFSAFISNASVSANATLTGWSTASPYFPSPSGSFNASTGVYTVPATGRYLINANVNFSTTAAITASLGSGVNPAFAVQRTSPTSTTLISALVPILNLNLTLLSIRSVLGSGNVNVVGEVALNAGDELVLQYQASGLTLTLNLGNSSGIMWSVQRLS
jgi:hypothetical protein